MSLSLHTFSASIDIDGDPTALDVEDGKLTLDEAWSPYAQMTLELAGATHEVWAALDPKQVPVPSVTIDLGQTFGTWNPFTRDDTSLATDLIVRSRRRDRSSGKVTLTLESDEALAQDYRSLETMPLWINQTDYVEMVNAVLGLIDVEVTSAPDGTGIDGLSNFSLAPGQSLWDSLEPILQQGGYRLYVWDREWLMVPETNNLDELVTVGADPFDNPTEGTDYDVLDSADDDDAYFDAVSIGYTFEDVTTYDIAQVATPSKVLAIEYSIPYPGPGAAEKMLARRLARGEGREFSAIANYDTRPGMGLAVLTGDIWSMGRVAAVTFSLKERVMSIRARSVVEATPTSYAWLLTSPGYAWTDVSAGVAWTAYVPT